jgi:hypothetical protein
MQFLAAPQETPAGAEATLPRPGPEPRQRDRTQASARAGVGGGVGRGGPGQCSNQQRRISEIHQPRQLGATSNLGQIHQFNTIAKKNGKNPMLWTTQLSTNLEAWLGTPYMLARVHGPAHRAIKVKEQ